MVECTLYRFWLYEGHGGGYSLARRHKRRASNTTLRAGRTRQLGLPESAVESDWASTVGFRQSLLCSWHMPHLPSIVVSYDDPGRPSRSLRSIPSIARDVADTCAASAAPVASNSGTLRQRAQARRSRTSHSVSAAFAAALVSSFSILKTVV